MPVKPSKAQDPLEVKTYTEEDVAKLCQEAEKSGVFSAREVIMKSRLPGWKRFYNLIKDFEESLD